MAKKQQPRKEPKGKQQQQTMGEARKQGSKSKKAAKTDLTLPLNKTNYGLIGLGFLLVIIGFVLMSGDENIYSFRKLTLSVISVVLGYGVIGYGIMKRSDTGESHEHEEKSSVS